MPKARWRIAPTNFYSLFAIRLSRPRLHLRDSLRHQLVHLGAELLFGDGDALCREIARHLVDHIAVSGFLELGCDDLPGIGVGVLARHSELVRHPQSQEPVAARFGLEFLLLVGNVFLLETFLALVESGHFRGSDPGPGW